MLRSLRLLCIGLFTTAAMAAAPPAPAGIAIVDVAVFDGVTRTVRPHQMILIEGDHIKAVGDGLKVQAGYAVIDGAGLTAMPGLIDLHTHIFVPGSLFPETVMLPIEHNLRSHLWSGVTTVVDLLTAASAMPGLRAMSADEPGLYPDLRLAGPCFTAPGGHGSEYGVPVHEVTTVAEADAAWAEQLRLKPDVTKTIIEHGGWGGLPELPAPSAEVVTEVGRLSRAARIPYFVHIWTLDEAKTAVRGGATALAHGVYGGPIDDELIRLMKERGTAYIPTLTVALNTETIRTDPAFFTHFPLADILSPDLISNLNSPGNREVMGRSAFGRIGDRRVFFSNLKRIFEAGIPVGLGTDAGNPFALHGPGIHHEIDYFVQAGLSLPDVLIAATSGSAKIAGLGSRVGQLKAGFRANILLVRGDPLTDPLAHNRVAEVIHAGVRIDRARLAQMNRGTRNLNAPGAETPPGTPPAPSILAPTDSLGDFDFGTPETAYGIWNTNTDAVAGGKSVCTVIAKTADDLTKVLRVEGEVRTGFQFGPWAGAVLGFKQPVDASSFTGIELRGRGTERGYTLFLGNAKVKDFNQFLASFRLKPDWQVVRVPFTALKQLGFGAAVAWDSKYITAVSLNAQEPMMSPPVFGPFWFELDYVKFYR